MAEFQKIYPHLTFVPNNDDGRGVKIWSFDGEMKKTKDNPFCIFKAYDGYLISPSQLAKEKLLRQQTT